MSKKKSSYKYCIVPGCKNTTVTSPDKYFFPVPRDKSLRKKWCNIMKRDDKEPLSHKTSLYCCEDHFNVEMDVENYVKYRLVGGRMVLKSGVLPHSFDCQRVQKNIKLRSAVEKRRQNEFLDNLLQENVDKRPEEQPNQSIEFVSCYDIKEEDLSDSINVPYNANNNGPPKIKTKNRGIQVNIKVKTSDKICQTNHDHITSPLVPNLLTSNK